MRPLMSPISGRIHSSSFLSVALREEEGYEEESAGQRIIFLSFHFVTFYGPQSGGVVWAEKKVRINCIGAYTLTN